MLPFSRYSTLVLLVFFTVLIMDMRTVWGVIWLIIAFCFFAAGILVGLVAFKVRRVIS